MQNEKKQDGETAVLSFIDSMPGEFRPLGERIHAIIKESNPDLKPRLWYGMPGYAKSKNSPVLCFFRVDKYMTFGLTEHANFALDEGAATQLFESSWFFKALDKKTEKRIAEIVIKATT